MINRLMQILIVLTMALTLGTISPPESMASLSELKASSPESTVKIAVHKYLPPFSYYNERGELTGYNIDLINAVEDLGGIKIELIPLEWADAIAALETGKVDAVAGMKYTQARDDLFDFSDTVFTISETIVVPSYIEGIEHLADLKGHTAAIEHSQMLEGLLSNIRRVRVNVAFNQKEALDLLLSGRADAFIGNPWTAKRLLKSYGMEGKYKLVGGPIQPADYAIAVRQGNYQLLEKLNSSLKTIRANGQFDHIYYSWFDEKLSFVTAPFTRIIQVLAVFIVISTLLGLLWNYNLRLEVAKRTKDLSQANINLKEQRALLAENDTFKEQILTSVKNGIITLDLDGTISTINPAALNILKLENKSRLYQTHYQSLNRLNCMLVPFQKQIANREEVQQAEVEMSIDKQVKNITCDILPLLDVQENIMGTLITIQDRTNERKLQQKLITQEKMRALGQLIAGIAHEIRNPLTSIKAFTELLPRKHHNPLFREEMATYLPKEVNRLNGIVEGLLDYSRPKKAEQKTFNLSQWLDSILILFTKTFADKGIRVRTEVNKDLTVFADPNQLKQVALNLIFNGIDAMEGCSKKELVINAVPNGDKIFINFTDSGHGIPSHQLDKIFDPFFTMKTTGVGLGLTVSYQLAKENHGEITVSSVSGQGTTVRLQVLCMAPDPDVRLDRRRTAGA